jgi:hypothetical protein
VRFILIFLEDSEHWSAAQYSPGQIPNLRSGLGPGAVHHLH